MKTQNIKSYFFAIISLLITYSCDKKNDIDKVENHISFEIDGKHEVFNSGHFWGGNYFVDDTQCPYPKCLYENSYIQHESNNALEFLYLSFNDSITGTYTFNSVNRQIRTFRTLINGIEYQAYSYTDGSDDFIVEVTEFGAVGERIKGTFTGTVVIVVDGELQNETKITNGVFEIVREEI